MKSGHSALAGAPWNRTGTAASLVLLNVNLALAVWGFIMSFVFCYKAGPYGNRFTGVWINGFTWVLTIQAMAVMYKPCLVTGKPARFYAWVWYIIWMFACALILLIGMDYKELKDQYAWAFLWLPPLAVFSAAVTSHRRKPEDSIHIIDVEAHPAPAAVNPPACSKLAWRQCWFNYWAFVGWSSLIWLAALGFFLALQAAWLVTDQRRYPPPGQLYQIDLEDGSGYEPRIHMLCKGPTDTGLGTFVLEAGGGSPGVRYAALVDELASAGRRACWYDRLGYGWSDDAFLYASADQSAANQSAVVLRNTLRAAGETGPFIVAGHSAGGQLAMVFAGYNSASVAGIALLDSYDDVSISLGWTGSAEVEATLPSGRKIKRPALTYMTSGTLGLIDVVRALTPLGWARLITMADNVEDPYNTVGNAMYGNNKAWQGQWVSVNMVVKSETDNSDLLHDLAYSMSNGTAPGVWHGTAWPNYSPKPVLLMPAEATLKQAMPEGCSAADFATSTECQNKVAECNDKKCMYASLYVAYMKTLSSNVSMKVMPGDHGFPSAHYKLAAEALLRTFAGV